MAGVIAQGPWAIKYGSNTLGEIQEIDFNYEVATDDHTSVQGKTFEISGAHKVAIEFELLETDIPALAVVFPQYHVANGEELSTGETVNHAEGAIEIVPTECGGSIDQQHDLLMTSCNDQVVRVLDAVSSFGGMSLDGDANVRLVTVRFVGKGDVGTVQLFREGAVTLVS